MRSSDAGAEHERPREDEVQEVECLECGFRGPLELFLEQDADDTLCPRCGCTEVQYSV